MGLPAEPTTTAIVRARCVTCGAHTPARLVADRPAGHCAVCGDDRLEPVTRADGGPAPPLASRRGRFTRDR